MAQGVRAHRRRPASSMRSHLRPVLSLKHSDVPLTPLYRAGRALVTPPNKERASSLDGGQGG